MVYDSIANAFIPTAAPNPKDFSKKKRVNRTAKLKQCKLDVRREQWLSQVKNKGFKEETRGGGRAKLPASDLQAEGENRGMEKLVIKIEHCNMHLTQGIIFDKMAVRPFQHHQEQHLQQCCSQLKQVSEQ